MKTILVKAVTNSVPTEENARRYIGAEPVQVSETAYYLRRISDGELVVVSASAAEKKEK